jgi:hypothetical protein
MNYWICHWQNRYWKTEVNPEGKPLRSSGSNMFSKRRVSTGDAVYIVSIRDGMLLVGGRMIVGEIVPRAEAVRRNSDDGLYDFAEWIVAQRGSGTRLDLHRELDPALTRKLHVLAPGSVAKGLRFITETRLDGQTTRGIRQLTPESAILLDRVIEITDCGPIPPSIRRITEQTLKGTALGTA